MKSGHFIGIAIGAAIGMALAYFGGGANGTGNLLVGALIGAVVGLFLVAGTVKTGDSPFRRILRNGLSLFQLEFRGRTQGKER